MPEFIPCIQEDWGRRRCHLPAEVIDRFVLDSTDGPIEYLKATCPKGHQLTFDVGRLATASSAPIPMPKPD